ncbi:3-oxoacyl-[acyl-carrier protein] reductase [Aliiruegeria haliotis]|uniref:3-oxoacyl-[acyl-carrier protein] reductase n=1 Tax=Aliiruegeria haliotis TaxID=1280846 RepID=A0A2T0RSV2_9RHOB|nr:SDR family NAD(P)-dependent oxidoreductase [Aliiruegeria haliotis]PRY24248.1 3-oxoacyl-[acyl-carrier protein] reductase [Aliiruegeria haliotis]
MKLDGKVAIVTGGGRDIGRACALRLASEGCAVAVNYLRSADGAERTVEEILAAGGRAFSVQGDMTRPKAVRALVERTVSEWDSIDILIPNAGGLIGRKTLPEMTLDHWRAVFDVNVTSAMLLVQAAHPFMNDGGSVTMLASQAGRDGGGHGAVAYGMAKGAIMAMTRGMAKELGPAIRVNAMCPGLIDTDFHNIFTKQEVRARIANASALQREGSAEEVADLALFLASDEASFITGACLDVNGGTIFS